MCIFAGLASLECMRIIVGVCEAEYTGRLNATLPRAKRVLMIKADQSVLIFSELGSYKPLNWMAAPCTIHEVTADNNDDEDSVTRDDNNSESTEVENVKSDDDSSVGAGQSKRADKREDPMAESAEPIVTLRVQAAKSDDQLVIRLFSKESDQTFDLGQDPGLVKDGVEAHLQKLLAEQIERIGEGATLVRREYPTPIGPVDIMAKNAQGENVAIEIKRHGGIDGVEQLTRYVTMLNKDPLLAPVHGMFAAQTITPQAQTLAQSRGFATLILPYDEMKEQPDSALTLF